LSQPTLAPPAPALAEIEEALVRALIVEKLEDGSYTVLVPSVPTLMAGAIYILPPEPVHPVDVPFTVALKGSRNAAPAPVNSSGPCKRQSHPRPRRRPPDRSLVIYSRAAELRQNLYGPEGVAVRQAKLARSSR
jgi:hypothetical protein